MASPAVTDARASSLREEFSLTRSRSGIAASGLPELSHALRRVPAPASRQARGANSAR
jgi:hypothetical protein